MKVRLGLLFLVFILYPFVGCFSQQKSRLSHDNYANWKVISSINLSPNGNWLLYELNPQDGDGILVIRHLESKREEHISRGYRASISPDGNYAAFHIKPEQAVLRQAKVEKKKQNETPIDSLGIFIFDTWHLRHRERQNPRIRINRMNRMNRKDLGVSCIIRVLHLDGVSQHPPCMVITSVCT